MGARVFVCSSSVVFPWGVILNQINSIKEQASSQGLVWVVVVTKPGQERRAKRELEQQAQWFGGAFEAYLPMKLAMNAKREMISAPFFPRYLFARIDLRLGSWKRIWSTLGVHGLLGSQLDRPYGVADWVIERLRAAEDAGFIRMGLKEERAKAMGFERGMKVRLAGSPIDAVFEELVDDKRATILVSLLGRDSLLTVDIAKLRATVTD